MQWIFMRRFPGGVIPLDVERLRETMSHWLNRKRTDRSISIHARDFVNARYNWDSIAVRWREHYRGIITNAKPRFRAPTVSA